MNAKTKRIVICLLRIALVIALIQPLIIVFTSLKGKSYPGVIDASDYIPGEKYLFQEDLRKLSRPKHDNSFVVPQWQIKELGGNKSLVPMSMRRFFLTQVLHVRLYKGDRAKWTIKELKQWMHYMYYSGVEHICICDHAQSDSEKIKEHITNYIKLEIATYIHWPLPRNVVSSKLDCYRYFMKILEGRNEWQLSVDMDEYPYVVADQSEGFLARYMKGIQADVVQVLMENYLMLGQGDRNRSMTIERITRRTPSRSNTLTKPVYRVDYTRPGMHRFYEQRHTKRRIKTIHGNPDEILMLHYWGARLQDWGQDTPKSLRATEDFPIVRDKVAPNIRSSLIAFGEFEAFSTESGP